jgi:hypothetical protein
VFPGLSDVLGIFERHPRRLPSGGLGDRRQVYVERREILAARPLVECPLIWSTNLAGIPIHWATGLKIGSALPRFKAPPISSRPTSRRNIANHSYCSHILCSAAQGAKSSVEVLPPIIAELRDAHPTLVVELVLTDRITTVRLRLEEIQLVG